MQLSEPEERKLIPPPRHSKLAKLFLNLGIFLIAAGLLLFVLVFYPVILEELKFLTVSSNKNADVSVNPKKGEIKPIDSNFGIVVPKIGANAHIVPNVNPYDPNLYQRALTKGVAQAAGSVYPGGIGNVFLFAHSSANFYEASRYNSVFYLLYKLKEGDPIYLFYKGNKFKYQVIEIKKVESTEVQYLLGDGKDKTLTLMTCWPPGTTLERLLVLAKIVN